MLIYLIMSYCDQEKPSKARQWRERSDRPIAAREMSREDIEEFRLLLADSYNCDKSDVSFEFEKIRDEEDTDRDDCLLLRYKLQCVVAGKPTLREIYSIKIPIPQEIRAKAEQVRRQQSSSFRNRTRALQIQSSEQLQSQPQLQSIGESNVFGLETPRVSRTEEANTFGIETPAISKHKLVRPTRKRNV